jgi:hypothetical protein
MERKEARFDELIYTIYIYQVVFIWSYFTVSVNGQSVRLKNFEDKESRLPNGLGKPDSDMRTSFRVGIIELAELNLSPRRFQLQQHIETDGKSSQKLTHACAFR